MIKNKLKRGMAAFLAVCMTVLPVAQATAITAHAAMTEIAPEKLDNNDGGTTTAYLWKSNSAFDIEGIKNGALIGSESPYSGSGIQTTFSRAGYQTYIGKSNSNKQTVQLRNAHSVGAFNGGVETYTVSPYNIELQMKSYPSKDEKWIIMEYVLYNKSPNTAEDVNIGSVADVQIGNDDYATLYRSPKGIRMTHRTTMETFELITHDPAIGVDNSGTGVRTWMGNYSNRSSNPFTHTGLDYFDASVDQGSGREGDSGVGYSWSVTLRPFETVTRKVAFGAKGPSLYVSADNGQDTLATTGRYDDPFQTIEYAITRLNGQLGYVYIQDYGQIGATISVPSNVTFMSADFDINSNLIPSEEPPITLQRAADFTSGPLFKTTGSGTMRFSDIILDGNKAQAVNNNQPLLQADSTGTIGLQVGAVLQNNQVTGDNVGSAIQVTGEAHLDINYGTIEGNVSAGAGAVNFDSSKTFKVRNEIEITNNTLADGTTPANVYLSDRQTITVTGELSGKIGITTKDKPEASDPNQVISNANEEIKIVGSAPSDSVSNPTYYMDCFESDEGFRVAANNKDIVLRCDGIELTLEYQDEDGTLIRPSEYKLFAQGQDIEEAPPEITGYVFDKTTFDPENPVGLSAKITDPDKGKVTGTMPESEVVIIYNYKRQPSTIYFYTNYGKPVPPALSGEADEDITALMPTTVKKTAYIFKGWFEDEDFSGSEVTALPARYPLTPLSYYAKWEPDPSFKFNYSVQYINQSGNITFQSTTTPNKIVEEEISAEKKHVPAYKLLNQNVSPAKFEEKPVGLFNSTTQEFEGKMPSEDAIVTYYYAVDRSSELNKRNVEVIYKTTAGTTLDTSTSRYFPEDRFTVRPEEFYGYRLKEKAVTGGDVADEDNLLSALTGSFGADHIYTGVMPNQDVKIEYIYESTGEGFELAVKYQHNNKDIINPVIAEKPAGNAVLGEYKDIYGYILQDAEANPSEAGNFLPNNNFDGFMPNRDLSIIYKYNKDASKWATLTYKAGLNGSITNADLSVSNEVVDAGSGMYKTDIIKTDNTAVGNAGCYNWENIITRKLVPLAKANQYYRFGGWFIDTNGNGLLDNAETLLTSASIFSADTTVTAYFEEDPAMWLDINFAAGDRGAINSGQPTSLHTTIDKTWNNIISSLPTVTPEVNYIADKWYLDNTAVKGTDLLKDGKTYTIQFIRDPNAFGTNVQTPDAIGSIDVDGKGAITVYDTSEDYQYIITDKDGNVVAVQDGSPGSNKVVFPDLYPGTRYDVYESKKDVEVIVGQPVPSSPDVSAPKEVLIPVVENNVTVTYDEENDGKTKIVINPADPDSDYAILDKNGNVVITPETGADGWQTPKGNNPAVVEFSDLDNNEEYTVVARPREKTEVTPESKLDDGTTIVTDPSGGLEIPTFIVETIGGNITQVGENVVNTNRQDGIKKGETVYLEAPATNSQGGTFAYWKVIIGTVDGFSGEVRTPELQFEMPDANIVVSAFYNRPSGSSNAEVVEEVRGGNENEMALDPSEIPDLEDQLTTPDDRDYIDINGVDVTYKVVFNKNKAKASEANAIKTSSSYNTDHIDAFKAAWGLDVSIERYVDGRKVGLASPSDATFTVFTQLDNDDVDMLDYQLYEVEPDGSGGHNVSLVTAIDGDPAETGGLFKFTAKAGCRYVLVYSKAYRVVYLNEIISKAFPSFPPIFRYSFRVRKSGKVNQPYYSADYSQIEAPQTMFIDNDGVQHDYLGWSTKNMPENYRKFMESSPIEKKTVIYAYYKNNRPKVLAKRDELNSALRKAYELAGNYFLTVAEAADFLEEIRVAQEVYDQTNRKATYEELDHALQYLRDVIDRIQKVIDDKNNQYNNIGSGGSGSGGMGSGGGSGKGSKKDPFNPVKSNIYTVGGNGVWELVDKDTHQWAFVLNGGIRVSGMWAWLDYTFIDASKTGWYHFNRAGIMDDGWFKDEKSNWYYCNTEHDGWFGKMKTGWHYDQTDKYWYYLDGETGMMVTGWRLIDGKWYYFNTTNTQATYSYDPATGKWSFTNPNVKPVGSMYVSEMTPDGYQIGATGAMVE